VARKHPVLAGIDVGGTITGSRGDASGPATAVSPGGAVAVAGVAGSRGDGWLCGYESIRIRASGFISGGRGADGGSAAATAANGSVASSRGGAAGAGGDVIFGVASLPDFRAAAG